MTTPKTYDENLLAEAPEVTKADLQDGYNPDLLHEPTVARKNTTRGLSTPPRSNSDPHLQHYPLPNKDIESLATPLQPPQDRYEKPRKPFWRTKKAIIFIAILGILIILAAVLGGVLGSRKKGNANVATDSGNGSSQLPGQGAGSPSAGTASSVTSTSQTTRVPGAGSGAQGSPTSSGGLPTSTETSQPVASGPAGVGQGTGGNGGTIVDSGAGSNGGPTTGDGAPPSGGLGVPSSQPGFVKRDENSLVSFG